MWLRQESCTRDSLVKDSIDDRKDKVTKLLARSLPSATFTKDGRMNNVIRFEDWNKYLESEDFSRKNNAFTFHGTSGEVGRKRTHDQCS